MLFDAAMICLGLPGLIRMSDSLSGVRFWPEIRTFGPTSAVAAALTWSDASAASDGRRFLVEEHPRVEALQGERKAPGRVRGAGRRGPHLGVVPQVVGAEPVRELVLELPALGRDGRHLRSGYDLGRLMVFRLGDQLRERAVFFDRDLSRPRLPPGCAGLSCQARAAETLRTAMSEAIVASCFRMTGDLLQVPTTGPTADDTQGHQGRGDWHVYQWAPDPANASV